MADDDKAVDGKIISGEISKKKTMKSHKSIRKSKSMKVRHKIETITNKIPDDFKPENLIAAQKTGDLGKSMTRADLIASQRLLEYTNNEMTLAQLKRIEQIEQFGLNKKEIKVVGRSCLVFKPNNWLRRICYHIVKWAYYDTLVLLLIAISTILLTLDNPNMDTNGQLATVLGYFDYILTVLFTLECMINIILYGFLCNGKGSYARDPWNIMDLIIVFFSIFTLILAGQGGDDLSILKIFRMLRVLRPLRFLKRNLGLKIQVISLMNAIPGIINLLVIAMLIIMIFGI